MKKYAFYDTYDNPEYQEYELKGEAYTELMRLCFEYCDTMSLLQWHKKSDISKEDEKFFTVSPQSIILEERLEKFKIDSPKNTNWSFSHYMSTAPCYPGKELVYIAETSVNHYKLCPELFKLMTTVTDDIFWWANNDENRLFEDPCFFRADGSCFFYSITHEGELYLNLQDDENSSRLFELSKWWTEKDFKYFS